MANLKRRESFRKTEVEEEVDTLVRSSHVGLIASAWSTKKVRPEECNVSATEHETDSTSSSCSTCADSTEGLGRHYEPTPHDKHSSRRGSLSSSQHMRERASLGLIIPACEHMKKLGPDCSYCRQTRATTLTGLASIVNGRRVEGSHKSISAERVKR